MTSTPILILGFNRPHLVRDLIDRLRPIEPRSIYVAVDGPRSGNAAERVLVAETRRSIEAIDWDCRVTTLFHQDNLGCGRAVTCAIDWLFEHESEGIILEDDIQPTPGLVPFLEAMLERYRLDTTIGSICGMNLAPSALIPPGDGGRLSIFPSPWGWATWGRVWRDFRLSLGRWRDDLPLRDLHRLMGNSILRTAYWSAHFEAVRRSAFDTWDYQFMYLYFVRGYRTVVPKYSLARNVGFDLGATHTKHLPAFVTRANASVRPDAAEMIGSPIRPCPAADEWLMRNVFTWPGPGRIGKHALTSAEASLRNRRSPV